MASDLWTICLMVSGWASALCIACAWIYSVWRRDPDERVRQLRKDLQAERHAKMLLQLDLDELQHRRIRRHLQRKDKP